MQVWLAFLILSVWANPPEAPGEEPQVDEPTSVVDEAQSPSAALAETAQTTRDPFKAPYISPKVLTPKSELEQFATDQFRLNGVILGNARRAMIVGPNGKTYFIGESAKIGLRKGVVTRITPTAVVVKEKTYDVFGKETTVDVQIKLPEEKRGKR